MRKLIVLFKSLDLTWSVSQNLSIYVNFVLCLGPLLYNYIRRFSVHSRFIEKSMYSINVMYCLLRRSPCLVVSGQGASGPWDGCIGWLWLRSISPTQIWVWLIRNAGFYGLWYETEHLCVQSLSQPWPR